MLAALSFLALILRYPGGHEIGVDSFAMHALASAISTTASMNWLMNPLSFYGLAPFSYSPAIPASIASFSEVGNLEIEPAILVYSLFLGMITPWTAFLLGRAAFRRDGPSLLLALLVSSAEGMVAFTDWTLSTRGTFLVFTPLAIALFARANLSHKRAYSGWLPLILVLATLAFVHALWLLLTPLLFAAWLVSRVMSAEEALLRHRIGGRHRARIAIATGAIISITMFGLLEFGPSETRISSGLPIVEGGFIPNVDILRIGLQIGTVVGIGVLLVPAGLVKVLAIPESSRRHAITGLAAVFLPISVDPVYGIAIALPAILLLSTSALNSRKLAQTRDARTRPTWAWVAAFLVASSTVALPLLVTIPRVSGLTCNDQFTLDDQTYNTGLYLRHNRAPNSTFVWDDRIQVGRIEAISGMPSLEPLQSIGLLEYPWLARKVDVRLTFEPDLIGALVKNHQLLRASEWLSEAGVDYEYYYGKHTFVLLVNSPGSPAAAQILSFYNARYAVERCPSGTSTFFTSLRSSNYVVYSDELQRIYSL
jgi:hypothetical protein